VFGWRLAIVVVCGLGLTFHDHSLAYFTVQSNLVVLGYYVGALYWTARRGVPDAPAPRLRDAVAFWITITGLVSHVLLEHGANPLPGLVSDPDLYFAWSTFAVHYVVPVMVVVDWLVFPPRQVTPWRTVPLWLLFPLAYALVAMFRAAVYPEFPVRYPYYFLDPGAHGGLWVAGQVLQLAAEFGVLAAVMATISRWRFRSTAALPVQPTHRPGLRDGDDRRDSPLRSRP
jgi:hypothetical protein